MTGTTKNEMLESIRQMLQHPELEVGVPTVMQLAAPVFSWWTEGSTPMASGSFTVAEIGGAFFTELSGIQSSGPYGTLEDALLGSVWFSDGVRHYISYDGDLRGVASAFHFEHVEDWDALVLVNGEELTMAQFKRAVEKAERQDADERTRSRRSGNAATTTELRVLALQALQEWGTKMPVRELSDLEYQLEELMEEQGLLE